jgi:hypothetical protein
VLNPAAKARREQEEERLRLLAERRKDTLRWIMSTPHGRRFIYDLMAAGRQQGSTYDKDQRITERLEGARDLVQRLAEEITNADTEGWLLMLNEAINASRASNG